MKIVILGNGDEERDWAHWFLEQRDHRLDAAFPGFPEPGLEVVPRAKDLDDLLARPGIDVAIVGGPIELRGEYLRRCAAEGLAIICLHPPGADSEPYYQVALSRAETGAVIIPDLPLRLHPGVAAMREALASGALGSFRGLRLESVSEGEGIDLARVVFPCLVDVVRALLGEVEALTATGDPPGDRPDLELIVQLRAVEKRRAELRVRSGSEAASRLSLSGANGSLVLEFDPWLHEPAFLIHQTSSEPATREALEPWDRHEAIFSVLVAACAKRGGPDHASPSLHDATRAMELSEATARSLRKGRTVDLYYEPISEEASFKSVMTSTGCMLIIGALMVIPLALAGPPLGFNWTIYIAYFIPPILVLFIIMQALRFAVRNPQVLDSSRREDAVKKP
jgi:myo-inositol 2-dehydrogenase/D-chiro-inositol 1-dehydrogenase